MKKRKLLMTALLLLLLTSCGEWKHAPVKMEEHPKNLPVSAETAQLPEEAVPTAAQPDRPESVPSEFEPKNSGEAATTLYTGSGYSVDIPKEGWRLDDRDRDDGVLEETWESTRNDDVELQVLHLGDRNLEQAQAFVKAEEDDFRFQVDQQGNLLGKDDKDREVMTVRFHASEQGMYAVICACPEAAAGEFESQLKNIADTFVLTK